MTESKFQFQRGNAAKLAAIPLYILGWILSLFVPRLAHKWVFGSGAGVGEGALNLALELQRTDPNAHITWVCATETEQQEAVDFGFHTVDRATWAGMKATLTARFVIVTHGLGDVNRFGIFGATVVQLWHGAPLKRLHFDSPVTTQVSGPPILGTIMKRMYAAGSQRTSLYVAGSHVSAERLRSAFRVLPGKVMTLGDPRHDLLARDAQDEVRSSQVRQSILETVGLGKHTGPVMLYAPTWRDGEVDPGIPSQRERTQLEKFLKAHDGVLFLRPHPLSVGNWEEVYSDRIHPFTSIRDLTPQLAGFDAVITDYSSAAIDFSLTERPIVWFAPDLDTYSQTRGLYEPLEVTAKGQIEHSWSDVISRLTDLATNPVIHRSAVLASQQLKQRFHTYDDGASAARVLQAVRELVVEYDELVPKKAVFFESYYGKQVACNPLALSREIAVRAPHLPQYWSVTSELEQVPDGAEAVLVGSRKYFAARKQAHLLIVNDWLRFGFRRRRHQQVLQTWHGTMLKHLALGRSNVSLRTRLAIHRESKRWTIMLSQNPHSTAQFRKNYAFRGTILESGYPRDDRLAAAVIGGSRHPIHVRAARITLGLDPELPGTKSWVMSYLPTWRERSLAPGELLNLAKLAEDLGESVTILVRGHTRSTGYVSAHPRVIDVSGHDDINDVFLASDLVITDYSSVMFDAAVAKLPIVFYTPDLEAYRSNERGFTFDFEKSAPGPIHTSEGELIHTLQDFVAHNGLPQWQEKYADRQQAWSDTYVPWDDGEAAKRVVDALESSNALEKSAAV